MVKGEGDETHHRRGDAYAQPSATDERDALLFDPTRVRVEEFRRVSPDGRACQKLCQVNSPTAFSCVVGIDHKTLPVAHENVHETEITVNEIVAGKPEGACPGGQLFNTPEESSAPRIRTHAIGKAVPALEHDAPDGLRPIASSFGSAIGLDAIRGQQLIDFS